MFPTTYATFSHAITLNLARGAMVSRINAAVPAYRTGALFISTSVADSIRRHSPPFASPMPALPTAATSAVCSGDIVGLYAADSTERPACTTPSLSTSTKPAGDALYGAYAAFALLPLHKTVATTLQPRPHLTNRRL